MRKNWDCYEVAKLIDTYFKTQSCQTPKEKNKVLGDLSTSLRNYAIKQGLEIDEKYRNLNGMILQLSHMEYVITSGKKGLPNAPKIFIDVFDIYKSNVGEYEKILGKANELMTVEVFEQDRNSKFTCWISEQYGSERASEIKNHLDDIEAWLHKKGLLFNPLYNVTSEKNAKRMFVSLKENKMFRVTHIRKMPAIEASMNAFLLFVKNTENEKNEAIVRDKIEDAEETIADDESKFPLKKLSSAERRTDFYYWLKNKEGLAEASCRSYISAVGGAEQFAEEHNLDKHVLYETSNSEEATVTMNVLLQCSEFVDYNNGQHNRFRSAINKYLMYLSDKSWVCGEVNDRQQNNKRLATNDGNIHLSIKEKPEKTGNDLKFIDFENKASLAFTRPVYLEYSGKRSDTLNNWTKIYVGLWQKLLDDYPETIHALCDKNIYGQGRPDLCRIEDELKMTAPKKLNDDFCIETNLSASDLMDKAHKLLELCGVDTKNVSIAYIEKNIDSDKRMDRDVPARKRRARSSDMQEFQEWLVQHQGMALNTSKSYASAINGAESFALEHNLSFDSIYGSDCETVRKCINELFNNSEFIEFNDVGHNRFRAALNKYLQYVSDENIIQVARIPKEDVDLTPYKELLTEKYEKGFRIDSGIEMKKFKHFWQAQYGTELTADDDTIRSYISQITIRYQDFAYVPETMLAPAKRERLLSYVISNLDNGKPAIYFDALFNEFIVELQEEKIYNSAMLKTYMSYINQGKYFIGRNYVSADNHVEVNPIDEVRNYLILHGTTISTEELCEKLSHIPSRKITYILATNREFISNGKGEYFHANSMDISSQELSDIQEMIQKSIIEKQFMTGTELVEEIGIKYPKVLERQPQYSEFGIRDAIGYKLNGLFSFNGNIISESDQNLSMSDVYSNYCQKRTQISLDELNNLKQALNSPIYFDAVYQNTLRISETNFVSVEQANFDVKATDNAIDRFCIGSYIPIMEVSHFGSFPYAGFMWNSFLLEHYVFKYSSNYKLLHTGFNANSCVGAIVKRNSDFEEYNDILTDVLANYDAPLDREAALQYLCEQGYLAKRRYRDIDQILVKATAIRTQKG